LARALVAFLVPAKLREEIAGDLEERFQEIARKRGRWAAVRWYWDQLFRMKPIQLRRMAKRRTTPARRKNSAESLVRDLRFAVRMLRKRPLFTVMAVATLGLGIAGATVIYAIADAVLLQKLPYPELDRVVTVWTTRPNWRGVEGLDRWWDRVHMHYSEYLRWRDGTSLFDAVALYKSAGFEMALSGDHEPEIVSAGLATASLQDVLGFRPTIGRWFLPGEDGPNAEHLVLLGHDLWEDRFAADPDVLGSTITLGDEPYTIIGVAPPELHLRQSIDWDAPRGFGLWRARDVAEKDLWVPVGVHDDLQGQWNYEGIGRLRHGASIEQAAAETAPLIRGIASPEQRGVRVIRRSDVETSGLQSQVMLLAIPAALLLIIACTNITTLLLGEAVGRRHEISTRMALGATKGRLIRQLLTESVIVGLLGSALGCLLATLGVETLVALAPPTSPLAGVGVSWAVLVFASGVGAGGGILFGLAPALVAGGRGGEFTLRAGPRTTSRRTGGLQSGVIALQSALTVVLLVGSGLFVRTVISLFSVDLGFDRHDVAVVRYRSDAPTAATLDETLERVAALPGIESVGAIQSPPMVGWGGDWNVPFQVEGATFEGGQLVHRRIVSAGYHRTMRIRLMAGRHLSPHDDSEGPKVAVVSETMARTYWPHRSAIGARFRIVDPDHHPDWITVVGVVADVRHHGFAEPYVSMAYMPYSQGPWEPPVVLARVAIGATRALPAIRSVIEALPGEVTVRDATSMESVVSRRAIDQQFRALLLVIFGAIAVVLAAGGVFGVAARCVALQSREIGIRKALGASQSVLLRGVLGVAFGPAVVGISVGLVLALFGSRFVRAFLFGVAAVDPVTYVTVGSFLALVCLLAGFVSARRIAALEPMKVLWEE
jgi:putative ABC transport system permease protein